MKTFLSKMIVPKIGNHKEDTIAQLIASNEEAILSLWSETLPLSLPSDTLEKIGHEHLTAHSKNLLKALSRIFSSRARDPIDTPEFSDCADVFQEIRLSHEKAGISPRETLGFLLSVKMSLLKFFENAAPLRLSPEMVRITTVTDKLWLAVFDPPSKGGTKTSAQLIASGGDTILTDCLERIPSMLQPDTLEKIGEERLTAHTKKLLGVFPGLFSDGPEFSHAADAFRDIGCSHGKLGIPLAETVNFVLSIKYSLSKFLKESREDDLQSLACLEILKINELTDRLMPSVFQGFSQTQEPAGLIQNDSTGQVMAYSLKLIPEIIRGLSIIKKKAEDDTLRVISALQKIVQKSREGSEEAEAMVAYFTGEPDESEDDCFGTSYVTRVIQENECVVAKTGAVFHALEQINEDLSDNLKAIIEKVKMIDKFVADINEIASQSKILAINAAIEAARAGEKGKRFSVVADEVRNLADISAKSAANISDIAEESMTVVKSLQDNIDAQINSGTTEMATAENSLRHAFERFRQFADNISDAIKVLTARYQAIAKDIETATVSLQFQDAISQEITEINSAMTCFKSQCERVLSDPRELVSKADAEAISPAIYSASILREGDEEDDVEFF